MGVTTSDNTRIYLLERIGRTLDQGPVIIGESHTSQNAREAIVYLIVNRKITILSIEGPIVPVPLQNNQGALNADPAMRQQYIANANLIYNAHYSFLKLITIAQKYGVRVYFHDLPGKYAMIRVDPNYDQTVDNIQNNAPRPFVHHLGPTRNMGPRNSFSGQFLGNTLNGPVNAVPHLAVLCGSDHTQSGPCLGAGRTMQAYLGIPDTSIFNFS